MENTTDYLDIKTWAKQRDLELRQEIDYYIKEGLSIKQAVDLVLSASTLGQGYHAQIKHDYNYPRFN